MIFKLMFLLPSNLVKRALITYVNTFCKFTIIIFRANFQGMQSKGQLLERVLHEHRKNPVCQQQYQWNFHYHKILTELDGTQEQKQAVIRKRILRYFGEFKLQSQSYHSIRSDVDFSQPTIQIISDKLVLYGIDFMSVDKAKKYFQGFVTNVRRMDDSHYIVQFRSENQCLAAINKKSNCLETFITAKDVLKHSDKGWIDMQPYFEFIFERKMMARFATSFDRIDNFGASTRNSFNLAYSQAKRRFFKSLQEDLQTEEQRRINNLKIMKNRENNSRSSSKERSREKQARSQNFHANNRIHGLNQRINSRRQHRTFERSRSRSKSPSLQMYDVRGHPIVPRLIQQQRIKQSNFKFELYIKKRDKQSKKTENEPTNKFTNTKNAASSKIMQNPRQPFMNVQKSNSTNQCEFDGKFNGKVAEVMQGQNNMNEQLDNSQLNFTAFLRNLKLSDSRNEYSAFDLEEELQ